MLAVQSLTSSNNTSNTYTKVHSLSNSFAIVRISFSNAETCSNASQISSINEVLFIGYLITGPVFYWSNLVGIHKFLFLLSYLCPWWYTKRWEDGCFPAIISTIIGFKKIVLNNCIITNAYALIPSAVY